MTETTSCLVSKLSYYCDLDEASRSHLAALEEQEEIHPKGSDICVPGMSTESLYVVKSGWLYSYIDLPDGRRQVVKIHHSGDVIGMTDIAFTTANTTLRSAEQVCLCPFPKNRMDIIFQEQPRLTALLFSLSLREQTILIDTIKALGRMSAREKLAYLLLELDARLRIITPGNTHKFRLPLSQSEIGDSIGLTNVYVSRTLNSLEADGYIQREQSSMELKRRDDLVEMVDFENRYEKLDTSWFPGG